MKKFVKIENTLSNFSSVCFMHAHRNFIQLIKNNFFHVKKIKQNELDNLWFIELYTIFLNYITHKGYFLKYCENTKYRNKAPNLWSNIAPGAIIR